MTTPISSRTNDRWSGERGTALVLVLMLTMLMVGLGSAVILVSSTETAISANHRSGQQVLYAADAGIERVQQDLLSVAQWNDVLSGSLQSSFIEGSITPTLADGTPLNLTNITNHLQSLTNSADIWGANDPTWRLYAYGPMDALVPTGTIDSPSYVAVWVGDDPSETDGNPLIDGNGVLTLHAEAYGSQGARKVLEVTVARTSNTEIERGYTAQRGQEELNQRARKAAVQSPGKALSRMNMDLGAGGLANAP